MAHGMRYKPFGVLVDKAWLFERGGSTNVILKTILLPWDAGYGTGNDGSPKRFGNPMGLYRLRRFRCANSNGQYRLGRSKPSSSAAAADEKPEA
jgi:hypothetical protein